MDAGRGGVRILIVDDQPANARVLERMLLRAGYAQTTSTLDPHAALQTLLHAPPDVLILDLQMPAIDGWDILHELQSVDGSAARPKVLLLTGDLTPDIRDRALALGATECLQKPIEYDQLLACVERTLEK